MNKQTPSPDLSSSFSDACVSRYR